MLGALKERVMGSSNCTDFFIFLGRTISKFYISTTAISSILYKFQRNMVIRTKTQISILRAVTCC
jgi:hypothetical protein